MTSERADWQSRISDAVRQCVPGHRTRNGEGPTAELRATMACNGTTSCCSRTYAAYCRQYRRPVCRDPPSMAEPCTADNGGQSRRARSRLAAVFPTSAVHFMLIRRQQTRSHIHAINTIWRNYRHKRVAHFWGTQCKCTFYLLLFSPNACDGVACRSRGGNTHGADKGRRSVPDHGRGSSDDPAGLDVWCFHRTYYLPRRLLRWLTSWLLF